MKSATPPPPRNAVPNFENRTLFHGDNLEFLRGLNSETIDLIATDPPFNKGRDFHATPDSLTSGASFQDRWTYERDVHEKWLDLIQDDYPEVHGIIEGAKLSYDHGMAAYLCYMAVRLMEMKRVLKDTGSIYLHCDPTASHYLKTVMDAIFGKQNFLNEIIWCYSNQGRSQKSFAKKHDVILFYGKTKNYNWTGYRIPVNEKYLKTHYRHRDKDGKVCSIQKKSGKTYIYYPEQGMTCNDWWNIHPVNSMAKERTGWPTQKPISLYKRILEASSNPGDVVLDPFCGCATTLIAAEQTERNWIGMDYWNEAHERIIERLSKENLVGPEGHTSGQLPFELPEITYLKEPPQRTDISPDDPDTPVFYLPRERVLQPWEKLTNREIREILSEAQKNGQGTTTICAGCGRDLEREFMELDHINPRKDGGPNHIENRILLCGPCNRIKKANLTLSGLHGHNKKSGWMHDEAKAKASHQRALQAAQKAKAES